MPAQMMVMLNPSRASDPEFPARMQKLLRSVAGPSAMRAYMTEMIHRDVRSFLPSVQVPTLILHKEGNPMFPLEWGRYLAENIEGAELVVLPGADVSPFWEQPEISLDAIRAFLARGGWWKLVVSEPGEIGEVLQLAERFALPRERVLLQPEGLRAAELAARSPWLVELCKAHGFRFSPRLHILIWGARRGV